MLLAVEGGGLFSSSASGYSKGLRFLLLGQEKNTEKPMRVSPLDKYQLAHREAEPDLQLASSSNQFSRSCASFICFGRTSAGLETPSPLKVGPAKNQENSPDALASSDNGKDHLTVTEDENNSNEIEADRKSNLKRSRKATTAAATVNNNVRQLGSSCDFKDVAVHVERRKVQWPDSSGKHLVEIREFEPRYGCSLLRTLTFDIFGHLSL